MCYRSLSWHELTSLGFTSLQLVLQNANRDVAVLDAVRNPWQMQIATQEKADKLVFF